MYPYECISGLRPDQALKRAEKVIKGGWRCGRYPAVELMGDIPWDFSDHEMRSWNYHIHSWDMIDSLLLAHTVSKDDQWLAPCLRVVFDWLSYLERERVSPFSWYDMAVGLRAYRLAYIYDVASSSCLLDSACLDRMWQALLMHAEYLSKDENIVFSNNHGYYQVAGQLAMGRRFARQSNEMDFAWRQGEERLKRMLKQQFTSEGGHREHSPDYHLMVYGTLRGLINAGLILDEDVLGEIGRIEECLSWFITPSQVIANFGDSSAKVVSDSSGIAAERWVTPNMQYFASQGQVGERSDGSMRVFEDTGYFVVRHPDRNFPERPERDCYLAQMAAFHSRTHKHADDLSFIWSDRGHALLVDAGRYGYVGKVEKGSALWSDGYWYGDPNRVYCESTRAHNALEFDLINYPRKGRKPYGSALRRWLEKDGLYAVETECRHFTGVRHFRLLVLCPGQWLVVLDWFKDGLLRNHDVRQWFHFAPELQCEHDAMGRLVRLPDSPQPLRVVPLLSCQVSADYRGQTGELMQGWFSPAERVMVPATAFNHALKGVSQGTIATLFSFSEQLRVEPAVTEVNATAREGRLGWRDERGQHVLIFSRPQDGEISVELRSTSS